MTGFEWFIVAVICLWIGWWGFGFTLDVLSVLDRKKRKAVVDKLFADQWEKEDAEKEARRKR